MHSGEVSSPRATPSDASGLADGTYFLGRYRIVDEIGNGGMASVHLARMDGPGGFQKWAAIKKIHGHLVEDDAFVQMFLDEARVAARISHPNVAMVFDLGKHESTYWIAMEYLHGEPLRELMRRSEELGTAMPPEIACRVIADASEGLHAAHELIGSNGEKLELVHRDVTPHNLFVTYDGVTKVVDFGIAKFASRISHTRAGTLKGKLAYMSPEQVRGETIDRRTDIFALGVVLWELTTGQRLFRMDSDLDTLAKVQECNVPRPSTLIRGYPVDLEKIVMKALSKNRGDRFPTARELSRALQSLLMRRGLFVASDEVAAYTRSIFADRIEQREAHLRWASEVTKTINVDQLSTPNVEAPASMPRARASAAVDPAPPVRPAAGMPFSAGEAPRGRPPEPTVPLDDDTHPADRDGPTIQGAPTGFGDEDLDDEEGEDETRVAALPTESNEQPVVPRGIAPPASNPAVQRPVPSRPQLSPNRPFPAAQAPVPPPSRPFPVAAPSRPNLPVPAPPPPSSHGGMNAAAPVLLPPFVPPASAPSFPGASLSANAVSAAFPAMPSDPMRTVPGGGGMRRAAPHARTMTIERFRKRPPMWVFIALSGCLAVFIAGIVIVIAATTASPPPAAGLNVKDPFVTARTAFKTAVDAPVSTAPPPAAVATGTATAAGSAAATSAEVKPNTAKPNTAPSTSPPPAAAPTPAAPAVAPQAQQAPAAKPVVTAAPKPAAAPAPKPVATKAPATATLTVVCMPKCNQIVDNGTSLGPGHIFNRTVSSGHHVLQLSAPNGVRKTVVVDIEPGGTKDVRTSMDH